MSAKRAKHGKGKGGASLAGKGCVTLFFSIFAAFGLGFAGLILVMAYREAVTRGWDRVECEVLESRIVDLRKPYSTTPYRLEARYSYVYDGERYESNTVRSNYSGSDDYRDVLLLSRKYVEGADLTCYVNPENPAEATLEHESVWFLFMLPMPLIFVAIGLGGVWYTWKHSGDAGKKAISSSATGKASKASRLGLAAFFSIFLFAGLGFLIPFFILPVARIFSAQNWPAVPCKIVSSHVLTHHDSDGDTYSIDILYSYEVDGTEYRSNRYHFMGGSSSGHGGKQKVVRRHRPGSETVCYVNPRDPTLAVLNRGFTSDLLFGLIPMVFVAVGGGGVFFSLRAKGRSKQALSAAGARRRRDGVSVPVADVPDSSGPQYLKPTSGPWLKFIGILFFMSIWNGIVSVFVTHLVRGWATGRPEWFLTIFMIPFVLVGLGGVVAVVYAALRLFNPRPLMALSSTRIALGQTVTFAITFKGRTSAVRTLTVTLEGVEEAIYQRGTSTYTDTNTFHSVEIVDTDDPREIAGATGEFTIPEDSMHTFEADHNKIYWRLEVKGDIRRRPDVAEQFRFDVYPS